jgi:hypothetical protein
MHAPTSKATTIIAGIFVAFFPSYASALSAAREEQFAEYDILFYDPEEDLSKISTWHSNCLSDISTTGDDFGARLVSGIQSLGLTTNQAAGILGNYLSEGGHPATYEDVARGKGLDMWDANSRYTISTGSYPWGIGMAQWTGGRRVELLNRVRDTAPDLLWIYENGMTDKSGNSESINSLYVPYAKFEEKVGGPAVVDRLYQVELQLLADELGSGGTWSNYLSQDYDSPEQAALVFFWYYEMNAKTYSQAVALPVTAASWSAKSGGVVRDHSFRVARATEAAAQLGDGSGGRGGACGLKEGGMATIEEAQAWLDATGYNDPTNDVHTRYGLYFGESPFCGSSNPAVGSRTNCAGWSKYFVEAHTTLSVVQRDGSRFVNSIVLSNPQVNTGSEPQPYSIFSFGDPSNTNSAGHTGLVVGVDVANDKIITIEAGCPGTWARAKEYTFQGLQTYINNSYGGRSTYAYLAPYTTMGGS